jgi:hypothetical protein
MVASGQMRLSHVLNFRVDRGSGTIGVSQGVIGYFSKLDKSEPFVTRLVAVQTMTPSRGLFGTVWFSCRWRYNFFNNTNVRSSASEVVFRNWITDV